MTLDWQAITVGLVVLCAGVYTTRRLWRRLRSFGAKPSKEGGADSSCASDCCGCGATTTRELSPKERGKIKAGIQS